MQNNQQTTLNANVHLTSRYTNNDHRYNTLSLVPQRSAGVIPSFFSMAAAITNIRPMLSHSESPSPASSSSTSIRQNQILVVKAKKNTLPLKIAASVCAAFTTYKRCDSIFSTGGGNGGSGTNGGFGGDGGGGGGGRFSGELVSYSDNSEEKDQSQEITEVEVENKHSDLPKYILSGIFIRAGSRTMFIKKVNSGRVFATKAQLESELKSLFKLDTSQEMHLEEKSNLDGTIGVTATLNHDQLKLISRFYSEIFQQHLEKYNLDGTIGETGKLIGKSGLEGINSGLMGGVVIRCPMFQKYSSGTYTETKGQLQKLLEEGGDLEAGTNPGGTTIGLRPIIPEEHMWDSLFPKIQSYTRWDKKNGGVTYMQQSDDMKTECSIVTGCGGPLTLASLEPRGTVSFEYPNLQGNASYITSVAFNKLFHPQDDINCEIKYVQGNTCLSAYKTKKLSPALETGVDQVHHPTWVDTDGFKANIIENITPRTNATFGMVFEKITAHSNGQRLSDGIPTTPSCGNRRLYGQATLERDNTKFVNGANVGDKIKFQIDQSLPFCEGAPFFNRHQLTVTRFIQLKEVEEGVGKPSPPPVLVLRGHYGGCVGELPHDTFTLGGPNSVRGYKVGEIGAARNILEFAAEVRVPVRNAQVYAFVEHGSSMGNPTEGHGHGSSYGVGAKLSFVRVEYTKNHNSHTVELSVGFGERF